MKLRALTNSLVGASIAIAFAALVFSMLVSRADRVDPGAEDADFVERLDLAPLEHMAVWSGGRLRSFDSFARARMSLIAGPERLNGLPPSAAYLDLMLRPEAYQMAEVLYVKKKPMRAQFIQALAGSGLDDPEWSERFLETGRVAPVMLQQPAIADLLTRWEMDVVRTAKFAEQIRAASRLMNPQAIGASLAVVPPPSGDPKQPWIPLTEIWAPGGSFSEPGSPLDALDDALRGEISASFSGFASAWRARDADAANTWLARFESLLHDVAPEVYPSEQHMALESLYFKASHLTWVWLIYLISAAMLLMATVYKWDRARWLGLGVFAIAFGLHTVALCWRWYVAGRWPNSNMFEAVTTAAWLGTAMIVVVELLARKTPMRNVFALCGAVASILGLMSAHYIPQLDASINNMMPILHDLWLYIHTNVIIASYAVIAMAAVSATMYLVRRAVGGSPDYARVGGAAALMEAATDASGEPARRSAGEVLDGVTMVLMELAFVMLWAGIVMGAIWADHSWGRPWGWDPKEVFALNTFLVFLILVHVRLKVRDKGLWTAILAVIGFGVMVFNWGVINFIIAGLHSYA